MKPKIDVVATLDEQLRRWVAGEPTHVAARPPVKGTECCPDFSCCVPELLRPAEERAEFAAASESRRHAMLMGYLGAMLRKSAPDKNVWVIG